MSLCQLYEQANFVLGGGVLGLITQSLAAKAGRALIVQPEGEHLSVVDAVGLYCPVSKIENGLSIVTKQASIHKVDDWCLLSLDEDFSLPIEGGWTHLALLGGEGWPIMIFLDGNPDDELRRLLGGANGLVKIWLRYRSVEDVERSMASISYLLYAVKSALPSIFEPFPPEFLATFLVDVMRESFCPKRISLVKDDGKELSLLAGDKCEIPFREGIFADHHLSPVPISLDDGHAGVVGTRNFELLNRQCSVVLPIIAGEDRFFYLLEWGTMHTREASDVLELIGGVTAKAMAMSRLREEGASQVLELSKREFALRSIHEATLSLMENDTEDTLLSRMLDIFGEMSQSRVSNVVIHDPRSMGYVMWGERRDGSIRSTRRFICPAEEPLFVSELPDSFDSDMASGIFVALGLDELGSAENLEAAERVFLLKDGAYLMGYVSVSCSVTGVRYGDDQGLETLAASSSVALKRCRLLDEVKGQRDELNRQVRMRSFLQELASDLQQIKSFDSLKEALDQSLSLALGLKGVDLISTSLSDGLLPDRVSKSDVPVVEGDSVWVPLRSGRQLHGAMRLIPEDISSVGGEKLELMALVGAFVAPRFDTMKHCPVADSIDLDIVVDSMVQRGVEELEKEGFPCTVLIGPYDLSEEQSGACLKVMKALDRSIAILPFTWDGDVKQLFSPSQGWAPFNPG